MATLGEIGRHLDLTASRVQKLAAERVIPRDGTLDQIRVAYIRHLRSTKGGISPERRRLDRARALREERRNAIEGGELVPGDALDRSLIALATTVSGKMQAIPAAIAPQLAAEVSPAGCQRIAADAIARALSDLADEGQRAVERLERGERPARERREKRA